MPALGTADPSPLFSTRLGECWRSKGARERGAALEKLVDWITNFCFRRLIALGDEGVGAPG